MKCRYCGHKCKLDVPVCPTCGADFEPKKRSDAERALAKNRILPALSDSLYLAICILLTARVVISIIAGGFLLFEALIAVFSWMVYYSAKNGVINGKNLRCISGTIYAEYYSANILAIIIVVFGLFVAMFPSAVVNFAEATFGSFIDGNEQIRALLDLLAEDGVFGGLSIALVCIFFAIIILLINLLCYRKIHRFAKSVYKSVEQQDFYMIEYDNTTRKWLWFFAIMDFVGLLIKTSGSGVLHLMANGIDAAVAIIAAILIKKYVLSNEYIAK